MRKWAVAVLLFTACPPPVGGLDASTVDPVTAYCDAREAANCSWLRRCGAASPLGSCPRFAWGDCALVVRPLLRDGVLSFDADAGAGCVDAIAAQQCDYPAPYEQPARCADVFVGTGAEGDSCGTCGAGLACAASAMGCGHCVPRDPPPTRPGLGEMCISPAVDGPGCARGLGCTFDTGSRGVCAPYAQAGESCASQICAMGLLCRAGDGGSICQPLADLGEACASRSECKGGLRCVAGSCATLLALGDSCSTGGDCESTRCVGGTCASLFVGLGDGCIDALCSTGLQCSQAGVCGIPLPVGASCSDESCEYGSSCTQGVCFNRTLACQ